MQEPTASPAVLAVLLVRVECSGQLLVCMLGWIKDTLPR